jgi:hypothetical protein
MHSIGELGMIAGLARCLGKEQRTAKTLCLVTVGVQEEEDRLHAQAFGTVRHAIGVATYLLVAMRVERDSRDPLAVGHRLLHIPEIIGGIGCDVGGVATQRRNGTLGERAEIAHIGLMEGQSILGQHHVAIDGISTGRDTGAIALRG